MLLPVYNCDAEYFKRAVNSILNQNYQDFELIIINDGSDKPIPYLPNDSRIKLLTQPHRGVASALNKGLSIAKGKYIARQDADDYSSHLRFDIQLKVIEKYKIVGSSMWVVDENDEPIKTITYKPDITHNDLMFNWPCISHPTTMWHRDIHKKIGGFDSTLEYCEDYDFWLRVIDAYGDYSIHNISDILYTYRQHGSNKTQEGLKNGKLKIYDEVCKLKSKGRRIEK